MVARPQPVSSSVCGCSQPREGQEQGVWTGVATRQDLTRPGQGRGVQAGPLGPRWPGVPAPRCRDVGSGGSNVGASRPPTGSDAGESPPLAAAPAGPAASPPASGGQCGLTVGTTPREIGTVNAATALLGRTRVTSRWRCGTTQSTPLPRLEPGPLGSHWSVVGRRIAQGDSLGWAGPGPQGGCPEAVPSPQCLQECPDPRITTADRTGKQGTMDLTTLG